MTRTASEVSHDLDSSTVPPTTDDGPEARCEACGHPLRAARSVALGLGPVCRRAAQRARRREAA